MRTLRRRMLVGVIAIMLSASVHSALASPSEWDTGARDALTSSVQFMAFPQTVDTGLDWPQVQRDAQRTGHSPEVLGTDLQVAWRHTFNPEKVFPQVQAIVYDGLVFVGTEMGRIYALNAQTGDQEWVYDVGAPILSSVAVADGRVFFGAMDGAVYALEASSGSLVWRNKHGCNEHKQRPLDYADFHTASDPGDRRTTRAKKSRCRFS